jgi:xanthine dehydrogenase FAD-binding subunit
VPPAARGKAHGAWRLAHSVNCIIRFAPCALRFARPPLQKLLINRGYVMIQEFEFVQPKDLREVLTLLDKHQEQGNARLIAGGTDIVPGFQQEASRFKDIKLLIDIQGLKELKIIEKENNQVIIGAGVTFSELIKHPLIKELYPLLAKAAGSIGSVQIRNRATIAGNFVNNAPCADSVPPLLVYDAEIQIQSSNKNRKVSLENFLLKPYKTQLQPDEIVTRVVLPVPGNDYRGDFYELGRRRGVAISRITLALLLEIQDSVIQEIRISSNAVTPIGKRFKQLEKSATGKKVTTELFRQLAQELGQQVLDITGLRWSTDYKLPVLQQMFYQLLENVCDNKKTG